MVIVKKMPGDNEESMIKKFSRKVSLEGILLEARRRQNFLKPGLMRKAKQEEKRRIKKLTY